MSLNTITSWSLQSPDLTNWSPSISTTGIVTFTSGGLVVTPTPPVFQGTPESEVWTPSISNAGVITMTSGTAASQSWATLFDAANTQWYFVADANGVMGVDRAISQIFSSALTGNAGISTPGITVGLTP